MLPEFLITLGAPAYALGLIEGVSDGLSSISKLLSGYYSDRIGKEEGNCHFGLCRDWIVPGSGGNRTLVAIRASRARPCVDGQGGEGTSPQCNHGHKSVGKRDWGKAFGFGAGFAYSAVLALAGTVALVWMAKK